MNVAYLASPYTHKDPKIKQKRHAIVNQFVFTCMQKGILVYSPLTHNVPIDQMGIHGDWTSWKNFDHEMISRCDRLIVLKLSGWEESKGVAAEVARAKELNIPIEWVDAPDDALENQHSSKNDLEGLLNRMLNLYQEREWVQFHSPKNLAMNLSIEAGELMEHFRWRTEAQSYLDSETSSQTLKDVKDEIGDIFLGLLYLAHTLKIDPVQAAEEKLTKIAEKYPEESKGLINKYSEYSKR